MNVLPEKLTRLSDFKVLSFDCYGTLIDWESGLLAALQPLVRKIPSPPRRDTILETFARLESAQQRSAPARSYPAILATVYKRLAEFWACGVTWDECLDFGQSIKDWPAFPDSSPALAYLKQHFELVILSNVDNISFSRSNIRLGVTFDAIYTAEDIGSYKPASVNFDYMIEALAMHGFAKSDILHTAQSLFHDHVPAANAGLARCWIDRRQGRESAGATPSLTSVPKPDFRFESLEAMARAHLRESQTR